MGSLLEPSSQTATDLLPFVFRTDATPKEEEEAANKRQRAEPTQANGGPAVGGL